MTKGQWGAGGEYLIVFGVRRGKLSLHCFASEKRLVVFFFVEYSLADPLSIYRP